MTRADERGEVGSRRWRRWLALAPLAVALVVPASAVASASSPPPTGPTSTSTTAAPTTAATAPKATTTVPSTTTTAPTPLGGPNAAAAKVLPDGVAISSLVDHPSVTSGATATFTLAVTNIGTNPLTTVAVRSTGCSALTPPVKTGGTPAGNLDDKLETGETWTYTCTRVVTAEVTQVSTVKATTTTNQVVGSQATSVVHLTAPGVRVDLFADRGAAVPGTVTTYIADVSTGDQMPLTAVAALLPECGPVMGPSRLGGDADDTLEPGETWRYACTRTLLDTATTTVNVTAKNAVPATITATDTLSVPVVRPAIAVTEAATSVVDPGGIATFDYQVTNPGDTTLSTVRIKSSACPTPKRTGGDVDKDKLLAVGEVWTFRCQVALTTTTVDTTTVTAQDVLTSSPVTATSTATVTVSGPTARPPSTMGGATSTPTTLTPTTDPYAYVPTDPYAYDPVYDQTYDDSSTYDPYVDSTYDDYAAYDDSSYDPYADSTYVDPCTESPTDPYATVDPYSTVDPFSTEVDPTAPDEAFNVADADLPGPVDPAGAGAGADSGSGGGLVTTAGIDAMAGASGPTDPSQTTDPVDPEYTDDYTSDYTDDYTSDYTDDYTSDYTSDYVDPYSSDYVESTPCTAVESLATTGTNAGRYASGGLALVSAGVVLVGFSRRRRYAGSRSTH